MAASSSMHCATSPESPRRTFERQAVLGDGSTMAAAVYSTGTRRRMCSPFARQTLGQTLGTRLGHVPVARSSIRELRRATCAARSVRLQGESYLHLLCQECLREPSLVGGCVCLSVVCACRWWQPLLVSAQSQYGTNYHGSCTTYRITYRITRVMATPTCHHNMPLQRLSVASFVKQRALRGAEAVDGLLMRGGLLSWLIHLIHPSHPLGLHPSWRHLDGH